MNNQERMSKAALQQTASELRYMALEAIAAAGSGHPGGSLSLADLITALYWGPLKASAQNPRDPDRDRVVLSKGHACPVLYAALCKKGYINKKDLLSLRKAESFLQGHPDMKHTPGIDMSTGSLGQGISAACGMALALRLQGRKSRVYAFLGDGEIEEGEVWEALMFASQYALSNLTIVLDLNGLQIDGSTQQVMSTANIKARFESFGMHTLEINGHDFAAIDAAYEEAARWSLGPTAIIAHTVKGKGVSFMENQVGWHGKALTPDELKEAKAELGVRE